MPPETVPVEATPLLAQPPLTGNEHENPVPQSASAAQGSSHLYWHIPLVGLGQAGGVPGAGWQSALAGQATATAHPAVLSMWQIIVGPQSASVAHAASSHTPAVATPASTAGLGGEALPQLVPWHAGRGAGVGAIVMQVNPFAQSAEVTHCWAPDAGAAASKIVRAPGEKTAFFSDMEVGECQVRANPKGATQRGSETPGNQFPEARTACPSPS
jgi:hypothetical protein